MPTSPAQKQANARYYASAGGKARNSMRTCRRLSTDPEYRRDSALASNARFKALNDEARLTAAAARAPWSEEEDEAVGDLSRTAAQVAFDIGRSVSAVQHRRIRIGKAREKGPIDFQI